MSWNVWNLYIPLGLRRQHRTCRLLHPWWRLKKAGGRTVAWWPNSKKTVVPLRHGGPCAPCLRVLERTRGKDFFFAFLDGVPSTGWRQELRPKFFGPNAKSCWARISFYKEVVHTTLASFVHLVFLLSQRCVCRTSRGRCCITYVSETSVSVCSLNCLHG